MRNRIEEIKAKGFYIPLANQDDAIDTQSPYENADFSKIRVGIKTLEDAVVDFNDFKKINPRLGNKEAVLRAINMNNLSQMREISEFFYKTSGIYSRLCRYMAYLYRYDWLITPYINGGLGVVRDADVQLPKNNRDKILENFFKALKFFDDFEVKKYLGDVALKVIKFGCYYGYKIFNEGNRISIQELPPQYCRSRYSVNGVPAVEFNMQFFDDYFPGTAQRANALKLFPKEFSKGYKLFKDNKLKGEVDINDAGWYLLDHTKTIKFNFSGEDFPPFIAVIPALIDLNNAQELDRRRMAQKLLKIIIQKMPLDKNGDLVFDVDEAQELHNNAVRMLGKAIGIDVLTTFADVDVADMADKNTTTTVDDLGKVERTVFNEAGVSQLQFNSTGNTALNNSILNDEASLTNLLAQFESFLNSLLEPFNKSPRKCYYKAQILNTTIYNYKEMAKLYKEQTQMGYSKMLPQIALGQSQSSILANAYFENDILKLIGVFVPPMSTATMNAETLAALTGNEIVLGDGKKSSTSSGSGGSKSEGSGEGAGRPPLADNEKSDKTIQNEESM